ncbi:MAG TPA: hypothetical protein VGG28_26880 [Kofleriaceae bacterium]
MSSCVVLATAACNPAAPAASQLDAHAAQIDAPSRVTPDAINQDAGAGAIIPVTMVTLANGNEIPTVQVSIGGSAPFTAELDTGSVGLRVVTGTIADSAWTIGTTASSVVYGSGVIAAGTIATANVTIGDLATTTAIAVEDITAVSCTAAKPSCPADGVAAADFRFSATFPAILGVGFRANANIASPLVAIGANHQYALALPIYGGSAGAITIDPDATTIARFAQTRVQLPVDGVGFDDTTVPFCVNALCVTGLLDTGQPATQLATSADADLAKAGVPAGSTTAPAGTGVDIIVDANAATTWSFVVGSTPTAGVDLIRFDGTAAVSNLGVAPFHIFDMFYDYAAGVIGVAAKL